MTFLDVHPIDPTEARLKLVATLVLLSELGAVKGGRVDSTRTKVVHRGTLIRPKRTARGGSRHVRPPRSC